MAYGFMLNGWNMAILLYRHSSILEESQFYTNEYNNIQIWIQLTLYSPPSAWPRKSLGVVMSIPPRISIMGNF